MTRQEQKLYRLRTLEQLLKVAQTIASTDKTEGIANSGDAYAHALGRCNGLAKSMIFELEELLKESK